MKSNSPLIAAITIAVILCAVLAYLEIQLVGAKRELGALRGSSAATEAHMASVQVSLEAFRQSLKQYDAAVGPQGTIQLLAKSLESGEMDLTLKSLRIVSKGKPVVSLGSVPDAGGTIQVISSDGTSLAEVTAVPGKSKMGFKATGGTDAAPVVRVATFGDEGYYMQKGPTDEVATRTDGAALQIQDDGADFFMAQSGGGNVSIDTSSSDERAKLSIWSEGPPKKVIYLSLGSKDITPFMSVAGALSGGSLTMLPDRLSLANRDGTVVLAAAEDDDGGFVFVNDKAGARRALMTAGSDGHGSISVYGNDKRSNTLFPEYNIQRNGSDQK
jgi:hypothetical protein